MLARFPIGEAALELAQGDIIDERVDAIVNAANSSLAPGGGVCGAIHRAAGPGLARECATLGGCLTGEARITSGYKLPARHVVHAVGPVYHGTSGDAVLLASAYSSSLALAASHGITSITFPALSTGIFGYPVNEAAPIAVRSARDFLQSNPGIELVRFVFLSRGPYDEYERAARILLGDPVDA